MLLLLELLLLSELEPLLLLPLLLSELEPLLLPLLLSEPSQFSSPENKPAGSYHSLLGPELLSLPLLLAVVPLSLPLLLAVVPESLPEAGVDVAPLPVSLPLAAVSLLNICKIA